MGRPRKLTRAEPDDAPDQLLDDADAPAVRWPLNEETAHRLQLQRRRGEAERRRRLALLRRACGIGE